MKMEFWIPGDPRPGGSKKAFPIHTGRFHPNKRGKMTEEVHIAISDTGGEPLKNWRASIVEAAHGAYRGPLLTGPLRRDVIFFLTRPKKPKHPVHHIVKPDFQKLSRPLDDSLTGVIWQDDSQIVAGWTAKYYGDPPGAKVTIEEI